MAHELAPFGCDLPMWHTVEAFDGGENHQWTVVGPYGAMELRAVRLLLGPDLADIYPRDAKGTQWLANAVVFHSVAFPEYDHHYFPRCHVLKGECYALVLSSMQAFKMMELAITYARDRDIFIHRALTAQYYLSVAENFSEPVGMLAR